MNLLIQILEYSILAVYCLTLTLIVTYSLGQLHLLITFIRNRKKFQQEPPLEGNDLPFVTIQLPIYNELYVFGAIAGFYGRNGLSQRSF